MDVLHKRCCGLDVHKRSVTACVRKAKGGRRPSKTVRSFSTMTRDLLALCDWLVSEGVRHVAMESTGVYWKPLWNIPEGQFELILVNARDVKQVPGRKTDVRDCEWIAELLAHGLLKPSFVSKAPLREFRDLTRHRAKLAQQKASIANRIQKILEHANIKLASVASDALGVSGRAMIKAIVEGEQDPAKLADLAQRRLRGKIPQLRLALQGRATDHHRFMLSTLLSHLEFLERQIAILDERIECLAHPFEEAMQLLTTIPGVERRTAQNILAEIGTDMGQFPSAKHLASWAAICPGNDESAGKRRSGNTPKGNRWLWRALGEAAWAASHTKETYLAAQYRRLASRRGKKKPIVAVGHTILTAAYSMIAHRVPYKDLGPDYLDRLDPDRLTRYLARRLKRLGHKVTLQPADAPA